MFSFEVYRNSKRTTFINGLSVNGALTLLREILAINNTSNYIIRDEKSNEIYLTNMSLEEFTINKMKEGNKMKTRLIKGLMTSHADYQKELINEEEYAKTLSMYSTEHKAKLLKEVREKNAVAKELYFNKIAVLKDEAIKSQKENLSNEMMNSKVSEVVKLLSLPGVNFTDTELQSIYDTYVTAKDVLAVRYINDYLDKNKREITVSNIPLYSTDEKIKNIELVCEYSINYADQPFELSLVHEKMFPKIDAMLSESNNNQ